MLVAYAHGLGSRWMALPADPRGESSPAGSGILRAAYGPRRYQAVCVSAGQSIAPDLMVFDRVFGKAPPTGFEPAHTAPEWTAVCAFCLREFPFGRGFGTGTGR